MLAYIQRPAVDRVDRQCRNSRSDTRHLATLTRSGSRFEDVPDVVLAIERLADPRPLPPVEILIGTAAARCAEAAFGEIAADRDDLPPPSVLIRRRFHPADRRAVKAPA
jgi:hypothetical protein